MPKTPEQKARHEAWRQRRRQDPAILAEIRAGQAANQRKRRQDPEIRARVQQQMRESYQRRRAIILEKLRLKRIANPEHYQQLEKRRKPEQKSAKDKRYRQNNRQKTNEAQRIKYQRRKQDPIFKLRKILRDRHNMAIRAGMTSKKNGHAVYGLGCTIQEFKTYIESLFTDGMSWETYGHSGWHLDHIKPLAAFDLSDPAQVAAAFHYTNLQPLWSTDNYLKGITIQLRRDHLPRILSPDDRYLEG